MFSTFRLVLNLSIQTCFAFNNAIKEYHNEIVKSIKKCKNLIKIENFVLSDLCKFLFLLQTSNYYAILILLCLRPGGPSGAA